jgi:hypothetical protein
MPQSPGDAANVDANVQPLLSALRLATDRQQLVVVHQLWHRNRHWALLPFHLHLRWPGTLDALPLSATFALLPFRQSDARLLQTALYAPDDAKRARRQARAFRHELGADLREDFVHEDWEEGLERHRAELSGRLLPPISYLAVDTVTRSGSISRGTRPCLGRFAVRNGFRPHVLVPARGELPESACGLLAGADVMLMDLQGVRGYRALAVMREVLRQRPTHTPGLLLTASPNDLIALDWEALGLEALNFHSGAAPTVHEIRVTIVGRDRPQAEREFEFAVEELLGHSAEIDRLADLAKAAWWSGRQAVALGDDSDPTLRRFAQALEHLESQDPLDARLFSAARELLSRTFCDTELATERKAAVVEAVLSLPATVGTLVLSRHGYAAASVRQAIADASGTTAMGVSRAGIDVCGLANGMISDRYSHAVISGYFGLATIDSLLACGAEVIHLVLDPIEARACWWGARKMADQLGQASIPDAAAVLRRFCQALERYLPPYADILPLKLDYSTSETPVLLGKASVGGPRNPGQKDTVSIWCVDGTLLEVSAHAQLEMVDRHAGSRFRAVSAVEVQPGDELVVVDTDSQSLFSERLMRVLDNGPLQAKAEKRAFWLTCLSVLMLEKKLKARSVHQSLGACGIAVNYQTVLRWLRPGAGGTQAVPLRWQHFRALAEALGINLPESYLAELYRAIREWRIRHRLEGRKLVRAMRAAHLGRLDGVTLARIEREWGLEGRELVQSARLVEVDGVIVHEGGRDAYL